MAKKVLRDVGSRILGEWYEDRERAYHIRRRLTPAEQIQVGQVVDIRGTDEATRRAEELLAQYEAHPGREIVEQALTDELAHGVIQTKP